MTLKILQLLFLGLSMLGTLMVFYNSSFYSSVPYAPPINDSAESTKHDLKKRKLAKIGLTLIILSNFLQLIILLMSYEL